MGPREGSHGIPEWVTHGIPGWALRAHEPTGGWLDEPRPRANWFQQRKKLLRSVAGGSRSLRNFCMCHDIISYHIENTKMQKWPRRVLAPPSRQSFCLPIFFGGAPCHRAPLPCHLRRPRLPRANGSPRAPKAHPGISWDKPLGIPWEPTLGSQGNPPWVPRAPFDIILLSLHMFSFGSTHFSSFRNFSEFFSDGLGC